MKAKVITRAGRYMNSEYYCLEITIDSIKVVFRLSTSEYMHLWAKGFQYERMGEFMGKIADRVNVNPETGR